MYKYQKSDYESMKTDALKFAKEKYFNGYSGSVRENFNLITSFIQDSVDKDIPSKTSRSVSSVPWLTPEIRRKICRKMQLTLKVVLPVPAKKDRQNSLSQKRSFLSLFVFIIV